MIKTPNTQHPTPNTQHPTPNTQHPTPNNTAYLNVLRVCAIVGVIMIHVFSPLNGYFSLALTKWESYFCTVLRNVWQWCVPIFVMISGVIFLDIKKDISVKKLLTKYYFRIILALFIFGIPYAFMEIFFDAHYQFSFNQIGLAILNVFKGKLWDHMWYLYMIAGLYLIIPFLKIFVKNCGKNVLEYIIVVLFIFTSVIPFMENVFSIKLGFYIPITSVYVFYLLFGYYIHVYKIAINNKILFCLMALYFIFSILMPLNSNFVDMARGGGIKFFDYNFPIVVMSTLVLFCFIHQKNKSNKICNVLSPMCFGIYLIHTLFINFLYKLIKVTPEKYPLIIVIISVTIITIIFSIGFTYFAKKIKIIKEYIL
jgi:surface polysaccharide O-acyltransferase-like enzyme